MTRFSHVERECIAFLARWYILYFSVYPHQSKRAYARKSLQSHRLVAQLKLSLRASN